MRTPPPTHLPGAKPASTFAFLIDQPHSRKRTLPDGVHHGRH
jgi:hypothetical protein